MNRKSFRSIIAYFVAVVFSLSTSAPAFAAATCDEATKASEQEKKDAAVKQAKEASTAGQANEAAGAEAVGKANEGSNSIKGAGDGMAAAGQNCAIGHAAMSDEIKNKILKQCESLTCSEVKESCTKDVLAEAEVSAKGAEGCLDASNAGQKTADEAAGSPSNSGGGGGMGGMGAGLLGAALGAGLMYMMNKKDDDKKKDKDKEKEQAGGTDCTASDAYKYSDCNDELVAACVTDITSAKCTNFTNRFCNAPSSSTTTTTTDTTPVEDPSGDGYITSSKDKEKVTVTKAEVGPKGEGIGTDFCKSYIAANFCKASDKSSCPSCLNKAMMESPTCKANPTMCIAQNSPDQIAQAKQTCPTDPLFSNPNFVAGASVAGVATSGTPIPVTGVATSDNSSTTNSNYSSGGTTTASYGAASVGSTNKSVGSVNSSSPANSSAGAKDAASAQGSYAASSASGSASGAAGVASKVSGSARDVASAQASQNTMLAQAGVMGQYGPSLFAAGSQTYQNRCAQNQLVNCAP